MPALTCGYAVCDITPPLGLPMAGYGARDQLAQGVHDPLQAQAVVFAAGDQTCALVATDLIGLDQDVADEVRAAAAAGTGLPAAHIMVCASHTHWGPNVSGGGYMPREVREATSAEYRTHLVRSLAGLVEQAHRDRVAAVIGWGAGFAPEITFNRRQVGAADKVDMQLALDPARALVASREGNRLARNWVRGEHRGPRLSAPLATLGGNRVGPADAEVIALRVDRADGQPLLGLVNFACHAVCGGGDFYHYSADFPGRARAAFEALTDVPLVFTAGCSGDQVPRWRGDGSRERVGKSLGGEVARVWLGMDDRHGDVPLAVRSRTIPLPVNPNVPSVAEAKAALAAHPHPESTEAVMERCLVDLATHIEAHPGGIPTEVWAMRLGDVGLVALPGEALTEIGLQIKQRSPFAVTMVVSCANACIAYMPTDDAIVEGGYEPGWSCLGPGTERALVDTSLELLRELC